MVAIVIMVMSTFTTVCAWVLRYLWFCSHQPNLPHVDTVELFSTTSERDPVTMVIFIVILAFCCFVVSKGISGGIEKSMKVMIPILAISLVIIVVRSLTLSGASEGLQYLFHIDTDYLFRANTWLEALGQIAWTMGPGCGLILSYAVYTQPKTDITLTTLTSGLSDTTAAILASTAICSHLVCHSWHRSFLRSNAVRQQWTLLHSFAESVCYHAGRTVLWHMFLPGTFHGGTYIKLRPCGGSLPCPSGTGHIQKESHMVHRYSDLHNRNTCHLGYGCNEQRGLGIRHASHLWRFVRLLCCKEVRSQKVQRKIPGQIRRVPSGTLV